MRSVRLRRGVAVFTLIVFCALLVTNLYAPDAGTDASRFDSTHETQNNALPLPAAILYATSQRSSKKWQDGTNLKDWQGDKSSRNWQNNRNSRNGQNANNSETWEDGKILKNWQDGKNPKDWQNDKKLNEWQDGKNSKYWQYRKDSKNSQDGKNRKDWQDDKNQKKWQDSENMKKWQDDENLRNWQGGENLKTWKDGKTDSRRAGNNRQETKLRERAGIAKSRSGDLTFELQKHEKEIALDNSVSYPSLSVPTLGSRNHPDNRDDSSAWNGTDLESAVELFANSFLGSPFHRKVHPLNQSELRSPSFDQEDRQELFLDASVDYRYIAASGGHPRLWPEDTNGTDDRIIAQLDYIPRTYVVNATDTKRRTRTKKIYVPGGLGDVPSGRRKFIEDGCSVSACALTTDGRFRLSADLVLLQLDAFFEVPPTKPRDQIWVMWLLESPINTAIFRNLENVINWTATYRSDSTIVTPYEKFVLNRDVGGSPSQITPSKNHAAGKTRLVAWFVSNCLADNRRWEYMLELRRYLPVDVFGACGDQECQRDRERDCNEMLRTEYKFYLSFENSNCEHYITEKFFTRALWNDVVPIAMGARKSDYAAVAPPHSYIHVEDFASPRHLADYLLKLNASEELYNEYFAWKSQGRFVNTKFWCRLCALLHDDTQHFSWYPDVEKWWRSSGSCTRNRWDEPDSLITDWSEYHRFRAKGR